MPWLAVKLGVCVRMSLRRLECRSASLVMLGSVSLFGFRIWGQVLSSPTDGSASLNIMSLCYIASGCVCFVIVCDSRV